MKNKSIKKVGVLAIVLIKRIVHLSSQWNGNMENRMAFDNM